MARGFADRLGPVRKWLGRHCGLPWDEVRAEIFRRFDTRTLPGRHIVFCHLLTEVLGPGEHDPYERHRFRVDESGVLRRTPRRRPKSRSRPLTRRQQAELRSFAGDRKIRQLGGALFWLEMTYVYRPTRRGEEYWKPTGRHRQTRRLTEAEVERFRRMRAKARNQLLIALPRR